MIPSIVWKVGAVLVLLVGLVLFEDHRIDAADQRGFNRANSQRAARDAAQEKLDAAKAAKDTKERQEKADADAITRQHENAKYEATIDDLRRVARAGNSGLRAPGAACLPATSAGASTSPSAGPGAEEGYVLLPETAESVLNAAADLRQGVFDRNALIDKFNECRAAANMP